MGWRLHGLRREYGTGLGGTVLPRVLLNSLIRLCSRHRLGGRHRLCGLRAGGQLGTALLAEPYAGFRLLTAHRAHGTRLHGYGRPAVLAESIALNDIRTTTGTPHNLSS